MTSAGTVAAERALPAPPPLAPEDETFDLTPIARTFWDAVAIFGPAPEESLFAHFPVTAINYREFIRFHPKLAGDTGASTTRRADRWMFEQTVRRSVTNGWLTMESAVLKVATIPPHHNPFSTVGGVDGLRNILLDAENKIALAALTTESTSRQSALRRKPTSAGIRQLSESMDLLGQIDPILVWSPPRMTGLAEIIVDGVVRSQILSDQGKEPLIRALTTGARGPITPVEVLLTRIELDLASTSKGNTSASRDGYIAQLNRAGIDYRALIKSLLQADERAMALRRLVSSCPASSKPTSSDVRRMANLRDSGWQLRDISTETGWRRTLINSYLKALDEGRDGPADELDILPKAGSKSRRMLESFARMGSATLREACEADGMNRRDISNQSIDKLLSDDLLQRSGHKGRAEVFRVTKKASQLLHAAHDGP